ncbi:MAG: MFS transporter [Oscillospiraceae bacterium]|nr:MFS transporter [Oscillospiraceae bacterium]
MFRKMSQTERASAIVFLALWVSYTLIRMGKNAYSAAMAAMLQEGLLTKANSGLVNAGFYLLYGVAQIAGIKLIEKVSPFRLITLTLIANAGFSAAMGFAQGFVPLLILWSLNGLAQFAMWPALLRVTTEYLHPEHQKRAMTAIAFCYCGGMVANYLLAAVVLKFARWPVLFFVNGIIGVVVLVFWLAAAKLKPVLETIPRAELQTENSPQEKHRLMPLLVTSGALLIFLPGLLRSALDLGIKTWMPTMLIEIYGVSLSTSNLLATLLVFINLAGVPLIAWLYPKRVGNTILLLTFSFVIGIPATALMLLNQSISVGVMIALLIIVTTMTYAGNQLIQIYVPPEFSKFHRTGSVASILNAGASFGVLAGNYIFGLFAEHLGWNGTIFSWVVMFAVSALLCAIATPIWKKFIAR